MTHGKLPKGAMHGCPTIPFYPELGAILGMCSSLLLQQLHFWLMNNPHEIEGKLWCYNTHEQWAAQLQVFKARTIRTSMSALIKIGIVEVSNFNKYKYDKTLWYTINYDRWLSWSRTTWPAREFQLEPIGKNCRMVVAKIADSDTAKIAEPIPKNYPEKTTKIKPVASPQESEDMMIEASVKKVVVKKGPTSSTLVKNKLSEAQIAAKPAPSLGKHLTAEPMIAVWHEVVPKYCETVKFVSEFTFAEKSMLKKMIVSWGSKSLDVLRYCLMHWVPYTRFVEDQAGIKKTPLAPTVPFLLKWGDEAVNFYTLGTENKPAPVQLIAPKPKGKIVITKKSDKVTHKELQKSGKVLSKEDQQPTFAELLEIMKQ